MKSKKGLHAPKPGHHMGETQMPKGKGKGKSMMMASMEKKKGMKKDM